ncbi:MAG: hypothetical protein WC781_01335 [Candidatus Pacearchaeota archaeon]|jgi:hypothetical protein
MANERKTKIPIPITYIILRQIHKSAQILQRDNSEIAEDYRNGMIMPEIVEKYSISEKFKISPEVARSIVRYALVGNQQGRTIYNGLIPAKEFEELAFEHRSKNGMKNGTITGKKFYEEKKGLFARGIEQVVEAGKKGGKIGGNKLYLEKRGIHAYSHEENVENGKQSALSRGFNLWGEEEIEFTKELINSPEYRKGSFVKRVKICEQVNNQFHNGKYIRDPQAISYLMYKLKNKK